jgi:hypothetical protein
VDSLLLIGRFEDDQVINNSANPLLVTASLNTGSPIIAIAQPLTPTASLAYESEVVLYSAEFQQIFQVRNHGLILGGRYQSARFNDSDSIGQPAPFTIGNAQITQPVQFVTAPVSQQFALDFDRVDGYGYYNWRIWDPLLVTAGVSYDYIHFPANHRAPPISSNDDTRKRLSPKAGFIWTPLTNTTVRAAYTRSLGGLTFDQSIRLEPSQVDGFNQAFRSLIPESIAGSTPPATFDTYGVGLSQKFPTGTYIDIEADLLASHVSEEIGTINLGLFPPTSNPSVTPQILDFKERTVAVAINQLLGEEVTIGARYQISDAELTSTLPQIPLTVTGAANSHNAGTLQQLNLYALFNHSSGFFASFNAGWYEQNNRGYAVAEPGDDFWQLNAYAGYRFWRRRAEVHVGLLNMTDRDYHLNPLNIYYELPHERTLAVGSKFNF